MRRSLLILGLIFTVAFCLATHLEPAQREWNGDRRESGNLLELLLGDGRRLFANHFFVKADVYFHSGYYPSIFDDQAAYHTPHMALYSEAVDQEKNARQASQRKSLLNFLKPDDEDGSPGQARDWIEQLSQNFYPVRHTHLDQQGKPGELREILPWLRLAVELDPQQVDAYVVGSFWLRRQLNRPDEAERFLREGLKANSDSSVILFELGRLQREHRHDSALARNLWTLGLRKWEKSEALLPEPNGFIYEQLHANLARLEEEHGAYARALQHLEALRHAAPERSAIRDWMLEVWQKLAATEAAHPAPAKEKAIP
ncbi:MAG: hypothetical protein L0Z50_36035 [Verrucomicrobiales bacterium]|nr:hypothetical protein [Verrucomicrobiales bacterium]